MSARIPSFLVAGARAGVNGAGKSSVGGAIIAEHGLTWFNPDSFARELMAHLGLSQEEANAVAWSEGKRRLEDAIATGKNFAFETTLGGTTMTQLIAKAAATHEIKMIYCGLDSVARHIARVRQRVAAGGHDIPEARIRQRWTSSQTNLIALLPMLKHVQVFDNSREAAPGAEIPVPVKVLEMRDGKVVYPPREDVGTLKRIPAWAKPIVAAALRRHDVTGGA